MKTQSNRWGGADGGDYDIMAILIPLWTGDWETFGCTKSLTYKHNAFQKEVMLTLVNYLFSKMNYVH